MPFGEGEIPVPERLAVPLDPEEWVARRQDALGDAFHKVGETARRGVLPTGVIENGVLRLEKLRRVQPEGSEALSLDLYRRITDIVLQADDAVDPKDRHECLVSFLVDYFIPNSARYLKVSEASREGLSIHLDNCFSQEAVS